MGRRRDIWDFTPGERAVLAVAIQQHVTPEDVQWHRETHALHTSGTFFLDGHREYLKRLELRLQGSGILGPEGLLPRWDPSSPQPARRLIPPEFLIPREGSGRIHEIWAPLRPLVAFSFAPFKGRWQRFWRSKRLFGFALLWGPHFFVHVLVGGRFAQIPRTPETSLFWIWHGFIDDLFWDWEKTHSS